ncbi:hypothetical protein DRQ09_00180 [candidate division KSB1 bacterium]|nr:MAG: hypothetical protein DRQ09_00180 [candidate division KSB1 bacterium]
MAEKEKISKKKTAVQVSIGILVSIIVILFSLSSIYQFFELKLYDFRFIVRGPIHMNKNIGTIDIDAASLKEEGRYQDWTRDKYAKILRKLKELKARMVGFDIYFVESSSSDLIKKEDIEKADIRSKEDVLVLFKGYDEVFRDAILDYGGVVLGQNFMVADKQDPEWVKYNTVEKTPEKENTLKIMKDFYIDYPDWEKTSIEKYMDIEPPRRMLVEVSKGVGYAQTISDIDGSVRRYPLVIIYDGKIFPALSLAMICEYIGVKFRDATIIPGKKVILPDGKFPDGSPAHIEIPIDKYGRMLVNWAGDYWEKNFFHISHIAVNNLSNLLLEEKIAREVKKIFLKNPSTIEDENLFIEEFKKTGIEINELVSEVYALVAGSKMLEDEIINGTEFSKEELPPAAWDVYNEIRLNHKILDILQKNPDLSLEETAQKLGIKRISDVRRSYFVIKDFLSKGGIKPEDHPLYFFSPEVDGRVLSTDDFKDKVFFYGLTAPGTWDLNPMPYNHRYPMLGLHANAFNTILMNNYLRKWSFWQNALVILLFGLLMGVVVPRFKPITGAIIIIGILILYLLIAQFLFFEKERTWIDVFGPVLTIIIGYTTITVYNFFSEEKEKKMIRGIFSRYVTKSVVDQLIKHPEMVKLGGEKKILTVFFSDVQGFTTISEKLTPEELVSLLNEYLTAMTHIVLRYDGMIDKYEGDAIMAVFGAPVYYEDHALRACYVSLDMQKELVKLREKWKQEGKPQLYVRIGLNTGPMVVGNMGAMDRLDYTVMGDSVNLGSRLEGANKQYGTFIMISEYTYELVKEHIEARFLDSLRVKGKAQPVKVYEVLERKENGLPENKKKAVELFNRGMECYLSRKWDEGIEFFQNALKADEKDSPSKVYLERCRMYRENPPPEDWDGVYIMTTK